MPLCLLGYMVSRLFWHPGMALSLGLLLVLQGTYIKSCVVASTMGPGVKVNGAKLM